MIVPHGTPKNYFKVILRLLKDAGLKKTINMVTTLLIKLSRHIAYNFLKGKNAHAIVTQKILGHTMYISLEDKGLSQELFIYGIHEPFLTLLILNEIKEGDVIIEAGANIGYYTLLECSLIKGKGRIIAIEPDPRSRKMLRVNVVKNGYAQNVEIIPVAISAKRGKKTLFLSSMWNLSTVGFSMLKESVTRIIDVIPLDELVLDESKIDVIRMDIEGGEFKVINGMVRTFLKFRPRLLIIELHPVADDDLVWAFFETLTNLGYKIKWAIPRRLMHAMLNVPRPLLNEAIEIILGCAQRYLKNTRIKPTEEISMEMFAKKFLLQDEVYHVIFAYDVAHGKALNEANR